MLELRSEALRAGQFAPISAGQVQHLRRRQHRGVRAGRGQGRHAARACSSSATAAISSRSRSRSAPRMPTPKAATCRSSRCTTASVTRASPASAASASCASPRTPFRCGCRRCRAARWRCEGVPTAQLLASERPDAACRTPLARWRCPIMAVVLALIAVPLARLRPRQGRYARVGFAVLIFFVYINLVIAGKVWIVRGVDARVVRPVVGARGRRAVRRGASCCVPRWLARRATAATCARGAPAVAPHEPARPLRHPRRARRRAGGRRRAGDARRAVPVRRPAGRHRQSAPTRALDAFWFVLLNMPQQIYEIHAHRRC